MWIYQLYAVACQVCALTFLVCLHTELSYGSPCACGIIHEAVTLSYASIKHHLQPAGARMEGERDGMAVERDTKEAKDRRWSERGEERVKGIKGESKGYG